ncbi:MAG: hypothetical protein U1F57_11445 [bacterium]
MVSSGPLLSTPDLQLLSRFSETTLGRASSLSDAQAQMDGIVSGFTDQATDTRSMVAMMAGGVAYQLGKVGALSLLGSKAAAPLLTVVSAGAGLSAEVTAFEGVHGFLSPQAASLGNRWSSSFLNFGLLKAARRAAAGQNLILRHLLQDGAMVAGENLASISDKTLARQFLHAEATNLQMGAGLAAAHAWIPGIHALERSLEGSVIPMLSLGRVLSPARESREERSTLLDSARNLLRRGMEYFRDSPNLQRILPVAGMGLAYFVGREMGWHAFERIGEGLSFSLLATTGGAPKGSEHLNEILQSIRSVDPYSPDSLRHAVDRIGPEIKNFSTAQQLQIAEGLFPWLREEFGAEINQEGSRLILEIATRLERAQQLEVALNIVPRIGDANCFLTTLLALIEPFGSTDLLAIANEAHDRMQSNRNMNFDEATGRLLLKVIPRLESDRDRLFFIDSLICRVPLKWCEGIIDTVESISTPSLLLSVFSGLLPRLELNTVYSIFSRMTSAAIDQFAWQFLEGRPYSIYQNCLSYLKQIMRESETPELFLSFIHFLNQGQALLPDIMEGFLQNKNFDINSLPQHFLERLRRFPADLSGKEWEQRAGGLERAFRILPVFSSRFYAKVGEHLGFYRSMIDHHPEDVSLATAVARLLEWTLSPKGLKEDDTTQNTETPPQASDSDEFIPQESEPHFFDDQLDQSIELISTLSISPQRRQALLEAMLQNMSIPRNRLADRSTPLLIGIFQQIALIDEQRRAEYKDRIPFGMIVVLSYPARVRNFLGSFADNPRISQDLRNQASEILRWSDTAR